MPKAIAHFFDPDSSGGSNISIHDGESGLLSAGLPVWDIATQRRDELEVAFQRTLARETFDFPLTKASDLDASLGWHDAMMEMLRAKPSELELRLSPRTCLLLPELCPLPDGGWLDRKQPVYRTVLHEVERPAPLRAELSIAILYQDTKYRLFEGLAYSLLEKLGPIADVNLFPGDRLADIRRRGGQLNEIFFRHRAVIFLGHLHRPESGTAGGWQLTDKKEDFLRLDTVASLLESVPKVRAQTKAPEPLFIPELILAGCCCGSWGAPGKGVPNDFFYPQMFLKNGVRFFIGCWMDIVVPDANPRQLKENLRHVQSLVEGFLTRWISNVDAAPQALFEAKQDSANPVLASLFQLYVAPERTEKREIARGPLTGRLQPGSYLGDYVLGPELWQDPFGIAFWAQHEDSGSSLIVQVLAEEWQDDPTVLEATRTAIDELKKARLPDSQLIPDDVQRLACDNGPGLLTLLYHRPVQETETTWSMLSDRVSSPGAPRHLENVLELGAEISLRLAELHARKVLHGNFDPAAVVFRQKDGRKEAVIKDTWVQWVQPGRCTHARYAAPDAQFQQDDESRLKVDCYGLGVLLFEIAVGRSLNTGETSVRATADGRAAIVPEALERIVRGCLAPRASVRPSADEAARRLTIARYAGGMYLSDLGNELDLQIAAGHRLFAVRVDRVEDLQHVLESLQHDPTLRCSYQVYMAAEQEGITDCRLHQPVKPWIDGTDPGPLGPYLEALENATILFDWISALPFPARPADARPQMSIVLIRGVSWWQVPDLEKALRFWRILKTCQRERQYPVVVVADSVLGPIGDLTRSFLFLEFPKPTPSELFERLLSAPESLKCEPLTPERASEIAERLYPCTNRELEESLRLCALHHGRIGDEVVDVRDDNRARQFQSLGTFTYTPASRLPPFDWFGWPPLIEPRLRAWTAAIRDSKPGPRRLLFTAQSGYGKTAAARALAHDLRLPLFRLDAAACLTQELGGSEQRLALSLQVIQDLGRACVLVDDLDQFIPAEGGIQNADPTIIRMSSILSQWIDHLSLPIVLIATAKTAEKLPPGWRRRFEMTIRLDSPPLDQDEDGSLDYRRAVLAALFRRFQLADHADNQTLLSTLAAETCPARRGKIMSAVARVNPTGHLRELFEILKTGADLEAWMAETLLLHTRDDPEAANQEDFWLNALRHRVEETTNAQ